MQELLRLQAKYAEENNNLAKQDRMIQLAQVYQESEINKDGDKEVQKLVDIDKSINNGTKVLKELSEKIEVTRTGEQVKQTEKLNDNLKDLRDVIKQNIKLAMEKGGGETVAKQIQAVNNQAPAGKTLKSMLFGEDSRQDVKDKSWTKALGFKRTPTMALYDWAENKDKKKAYEKEKSSFIEGALKNDKRGIALKNLKGEDYAREDAGKRFDAIKAKEAEISNIQKIIDESRAAGYDPKKKDINLRNAAASELTEMDPRRKKAFLGEKSEDQYESDVQTAKSSAGMIAASTAMGATLIQSLEVQKQQLESLKGILTAVEEGGAGGSGGGLLDAAADLAGGMGRKARGIGGRMATVGSKAAGFLARNGAKLGAVGGIAMGAYDAYTGWGEANDQYEAGEITKNEADIKKGEAVGGGAGGALGAWGGAAAGAAIGSVVPVVGTAIGAVAGGALGYLGGTAIGKKAGGALVSGYKGVKNWLGFGNPEDDKKKVNVERVTEEYTTIANERVVPGEPLSDKQMATIKYVTSTGDNPYPKEVMDQYEKQKADFETRKGGGAQQIMATPSVASSVNESPVIEASRNNENIRAENAGTSNNTIINAPNNSVTNTGSSGPDASLMRSPIRNPESTVSKYIDSKFAV